MKLNKHLSRANSGIPNRGLTFEQFSAYKDRCLNYEDNLDPDHYFYDFDLKEHNSHAEQHDKISEKRRLEAEDQMRQKRLPPRVVIRKGKSAKTGTYSTKSSLNKLDMTESGVSPTRDTIAMSNFYERSLNMQDDPYGKLETITAPGLSISHKDGQLIPIEKSSLDSQTLQQSIVSEKFFFVPE